jgi:hypothetical protein
MRRALRPIELYPQIPFPSRPFALSPEWRLMTAAARAMTRPTPIIFINAMPDVINPPTTTDRLRPDAALRFRRIMSSNNVAGCIIFEKLLLTSQK